MNKNRLIFYAVFTAFHLGAFIFTLKIQDFTFLTKIYEYINFFKYVSFFGIVLIVSDIIWSYTINNQFQKEKNSLQNELTNLKAKLFDLQEDAKKVTPPPTTQENK